MTKNKTVSVGLIVGGVIIVLVVGVLLWAGGTYNSLVARAGKVDESWANIESNLQRRSDLIPSLVSTVRGYAAHEEELFTQISEARAQLAGVTDPAAVSQADGVLTAGLGRLLAVVEAYPDLKASGNFMALQDELAGTENRLAVARKDYNEQATAYNVQIRTLPTNLLANMFGFDARELYQITDAARTVPVVDFE
jgi:LemA protein